MPQVTDIKTSVAIPSLIKDSFIAQGTVKKNPSGVPMMYTGGFTAVFPFLVNNEQWAFRCWHTEMGNVKQRMELISKDLHKTNLPYFCDFAYVDEGIVVNGKIYPTTRMRWVEGLVIKEYIEQHHSKQDLEQLAANFLLMCKDLHKHHFAHGDLQHGNIMVNNQGKLFLIDYDSMYVPSMQNKFSDHISGLIDYQHPARKKNQILSEKVDYFSELIIYISILALANDFSLWDKYQVVDTEQMLFKADDFRDLKHSQIYTDLQQLGGVFPLLLNILDEYLQKSSVDKLVPFDELTKQQIPSQAIPLTPKKLSVVREDKFETQGATYRIIDSKNVALEKGPTAKNTVSIPSTITYQGKKYNVTEIGYSAFEGYNELSSIIIPSSVVEIGDSAFEGCHRLKSITIPASVKTIGFSAFSDCTRLTSITIPHGVTLIEVFAFQGCHGLTSVHIPYSVTAIEDSAFEGCSSLQFITIPNSVTNIGDSAFKGCKKITSIIIPDSVKTIGDSAFRECIALTSVTISTSVIKIGDSAFKGCNMLTSVKIPNRKTTSGGKITEAERIAQEVAERIARKKAAEKAKAERIAREQEEKRRREEAERAERAKREREWEQRKQEEERIKKEREEEEKRIWLIILGIGSFILSIFLPFIGLPIFFYIVFKYF